MSEYQYYEFRAPDPWAPPGFQAPEAESMLADEPVRDLSLIGLFNGAPDLAERSAEILREEFAKAHWRGLESAPAMA